MKTKTQTHTPGPWRAYLNGQKTQWFVSCGENDAPANALNTLAAIHYVGNEQEANARLIAAAPDLLEAAKEALARLEKDYPFIVIDKKDSLRMAIAKAEGKS